MEEVTGINWAEVAFQVEAGRGLPELHFAAPSQAVGRLRLRQRLQYDAAERWIADHQRGQLLPPLNLPALEVSPRSSLYADLTRHAGFSPRCVCLPPAATKFWQCFTPFLLFPL